MCNRVCHDAHVPDSFFAIKAQAAGAAAATACVLQSSALYDAKGFVHDSDLDFMDLRIDYGSQGGGFVPSPLSKPSSSVEKLNRRNSSVGVPSGRARVTSASAGRS